MRNITLDRYNSYVALITINNPEKQNAFDAAILNELLELLKDIEKDKSFRTVYITGSGENAFSSGVFLKDLVEFKDTTEARNYASLLDATMDGLYNLPKPVIAMINGYALGGGFGLAMSSDIRIITHGARIGFPAVKIGAILPPGCTYRLISLIGAGRAKELLLTGRYVTAEEALSMGMVNYVVKDREALFKKADELTQMILEGPDTALAITKATVNKHTNELIYRYNLYSPDNFAYLFTTKDWQERIHKFLNRKNTKKNV
ncbi:MAG: enoyl-CoA hydratase/isomerase family protein [bacterium]